MIKNSVRQSRFYTCRFMISGWVKFSLHKWRVDEGVPGTQRRQNYKIKTERQRGRTGETKSKKKD